MALPSRPNTVDVGVIDDTPIVKHGANECQIVDEDDIKTHLSHGTSPNDGNHDGSFTGSPFSNGPGPATVCGDLSGLVRVGADAVYIDDCGKPHGTFSFVSEDNLQETLQELGFIGLELEGLRARVPHRGQWRLADAGRRGCLGHGRRL